MGMNFLTSLSAKEAPPARPIKPNSKGAITGSRWEKAVLITPDLAKKYLEANTCNRPIRETYAIAMGRDMAEGRWKYNHQPIMFGFDGSLLDGQHRLRACIESGASFLTDIIWDASPDVMDTVDIGAIRSAGDIAHLQGLPHSRQAVAIAHLLIIHEKHGIERKNNPRMKPTKPEVVARALSDKMLQEVSAATHGWRIGVPSTAGFCMYLFMKQKPALAEKFFTELRSGEMLNGTSPVFHLRAKIIKDMASKARLPQLHIIALFFRAWVAYRDGRRMSILKTWIPEDQEFPRL